MPQRVKVPTWWLLPDGREVHLTERRCSLVVQERYRLAFQLDGITKDLHSLNENLYDQWLSSANLDASGMSDTGIDTALKMENADKSTRKLAKTNTKFNYKVLAKIIGTVQKYKKKAKEWHQKDVVKGLKYFHEVPNVESARQYMREERAPRTYADVIDFVAASLFPENTPDDNKDRAQCTAILQAEVWKIAIGHRADLSLAGGKKKKLPAEEKLLAEYAPGMKARISLEKALKAKKDPSGGADAKLGRPGRHRPPHGREGPQRHESQEVLCGNRREPRPRASLRQC